MKRRDFLVAAAGAASAPLLRSAAVQGHGVQAALVLRGGTVVDGSGRDRFASDIRIEGDRITAIGPSVSTAGAEVIDVRDHVVAPGFIDIHSHTDTELFAHPRAESKIRQGVTTEVAGQDGGSVAPSSPEETAAARLEYGDDADLSTFGGLFRALERRRFAVNFASMVGAGTVRGLVVGVADRPATAAELEEMRAVVRRALADGVCGLSSGLEYTPGGFADRAELVALASEMRDTGLPYASHMRNEDDALLGAIEEALHVGRVAEVPVQISHLKAQGERNWWKAQVALDMIEAARAAGVDVHFDRYPYVAYATGLSNLFPLWSRDGGTAAMLERLGGPDAPRIEEAVREKIAQLGTWDAVQITSTGDDGLAWARGRRLGALAVERGVEPYALLVELMRSDRGRPGMVGFGMSEENTARILAHPLAMVCSDGSALATEGPLRRGSPHPRSFGSFPRVLGHYVRELRAMTLEQAVQKMTGLPAAKLRLEGRGTLARGGYADVVVFDPDTVADTATFEQPFAYPMGIPHVFVNGHAVVRAGEHTGELPGRVVRPIRVS